MSINLIRPKPFGQNRPLRLIQYRKREVSACVEWKRIDIVVVAVIVDVVSVSS